MNEQEEIAKTDSTEQKIKEAARRVFTRKGYAATRTRDIAEESGYNLALINYYFRSKEKLFDLIMMENIQLFLGSIMGMLDDGDTTLDEKIAHLVDYYIDMLIANPGMPVFILNSVNNDPKALLEKVGAPDIGIADTHFVKQFVEVMTHKKGIKMNPMHLFMNLIAMTVFPFAAAPMIKAKNGLNDEVYNNMMLERKKLIPLWLKAMIEGV